MGSGAGKGKPRRNRSAPSLELRGNLAESCDQAGVGPLSLAGQDELYPNAIRPCQPGILLSPAALRKRRGGCLVNSFKACGAGHFTKCLRC